MVNVATDTPIGDYALIGDCRGAGLVSRDGSLDWLCLPRFDSPALFAAILDNERGGRFRIRPADPYRAERRYLPDTNIVETTFIAEGGTVALRDLLAVASEEERRAKLVPEQEILREVVGLAGELALDILYEPRPGTGRDHPALRDRGAFGIWGEADSAAYILMSELPLALAGDGASATGRARIRAGDRRYFSLSYGVDAPAVLPPLGEHAGERIARSARWWRAWVDRCTYRGPYREAIVRSALALKLLAYAPSGAIVAAPTTSLPERIGGERNWDYRYCWLRDASFTLRALLALGFAAEGEAFLGWLLHATRLTWPELQVVYDVFGEARLPERELPHLAGYADSRPIRVGNAAADQLQLDVYGELIDAVARVARDGRRFDRDTARLLDGLGRTVCRRWREPDEGIWEGRAGRQHHTHSKVLCWVALDRLVALHEDGHCELPSADRFREEQAAIRAEIEARGFNAQLGSYTRLLDGDDLDASLLTLPLYGYLDAAHPRMRGTVARIRERLGRGALVYRYADGATDGLPAGEGAFGICGFWAVECLARAGEIAEAARAFEGLLAYANDVGLYGEETDPATGAALGNFPQAFTQVGLINAALTLAECQRGEPRAASGQPDPSARQARMEDCA
ncbi:MAG: glycoside hydrolase family 15 protein [Chloroflexia bacterium]